MKLLLLILLFTSSTSFFYSQNYSRVKVFGNSNELNKLSNLGVTIDHGTYKKETFFISDFSANEIQIMKKNGFSFEIIISDVKEHYKNILESKNQTAIQKNTLCSNSSGGYSITTPTNFNLGSMGGYLTYSEMLSELDDMAQQYPNLITAKTPIHNFLTHERI